MSGWFWHYPKKKKKKEKNISRLLPLCPMNDTFSETEGQGLLYCPYKPLWNSLKLVEKRVSTSVKTFFDPSIRKSGIVEQSYLCWADSSVHGGPWKIWNSHSALINMANIMWKHFFGKLIWKKGRKGILSVFKKTLHGFWK